MYFRLSGSRVHVEDFQRRIEGAAETFSLLTFLCYLKVNIFVIK